MISPGREDHPRLYLGWEKEGLRSRRRSASESNQSGVEVDLRIPGSDGSDDFQGSVYIESGHEYGFAIGDKVVAIEDSDGGWFLAHDSEVRDFIHHDIPA